MTTTQKQRLIKALTPEFFQLHELSFEQLLDWAKQFAATLPYHDENNHQAGSWAAMFETNELVICACILSLDPYRCRQQFKQAMQLGESPAIDYLIGLYRQFNSWYQYLPSQPELAYQLKFVLLGHYRNKLIAPLQQLLSCIPEEKRSYFSQFDPLWQLDQTVTTPPKFDFIQHSFSAAIMTLKTLQKDCHIYLQQSLKHGEHPPQLALYVSFLRLFQLARVRINQFNERHLNFYYRDVLRQTEQSAPDNHTYLKLSLNNHRGTPVTMTENTLISPGQDAQFQRIDYRTAYPILVTDAEVRQVHQLSFKRDPLISPEREAGLVCGINSQSITIAPDAAPPELPDTQSFTLFSADTLNQNQTMGLVVADPVLAMAQGKRQVSVKFQLGEKQREIIDRQLYRLSQPDSKVTDEIQVLFTQLLTIHRHTLGEPERIELIAEQLVATLSPIQCHQLANAEADQQINLIYREFLLALLQQAKQPEQFYRIFGLLITRHALSDTDWLSPADISLIRAQAEKTLSGPAKQTVHELLMQSKTAVFYLLFSNLFDAELTTEEGWLAITHYQIYPLPTPISHRYGFTLIFNLEPGFAAIIPPNQELINQGWDMLHPAFKLTLKNQTNCFPYSIFRDFELMDLQLDTRIEGLTQLQLFNNEGASDPSQPFHPFGVLPNDESYLVIASEELARKHIHTLSVDMHWTDLPRGSDGFRQYYQGYPYAYCNHSFQVALEVLSNGQWQSVGAPSYALFAPKEGSLQRTQQLQLSMQHAFTPVTQPWPQTPFSSQSSIRNGLFKIKLIAPQTAFGHRLYAPLLSQTLIANTKNKKKDKLQPLPNSPYTPQLSRFAVNYHAQSTLDLKSPSPTNHSQIIHLHPFGKELIYPPADPLAPKAQRLMANYPHDSYLFIGLSASQLSGYLNLFLLLDGQSKILSPYPSNDYHWAYLVDNQWLTLPPKQIVHDSTQGFITTGVITLDLPDTINTHHSIMPDGYYWLCVSTDCGIGLYPNCRHIATHVIEVKGQPNPSLTPWSTWRVSPKPANLANIMQLTPLHAAPKQENRQQWIARVSEKLHHKGLAITPWDYEHLVLEQFADIGSVSCFAHHRFDSHQNVPGHVLIIVTPQPIHCQHNPCIPVTISSAKLLAIRDYLQSVSRSGCQVEVRHPGYERIQVRCQVTLKVGTHHGLALRHLNYAISEHLCPWKNDTANLGLGWQLSLSKLVAFISQFPFVSHVTGLSVLKISQLQQTNYQLQDSASSEPTIAAEYPWYILLPAEHHHIQVTPQPLEISPQPVGVGQLTIGEQFIINRSGEPSLGED
ncbi:hypothetical protein [Celerinatantimonas yamalensis]|uniref:Baseplate J-like protein n=1 Tax=Celerinatantimonas yamalensis TaxID=559956 RepID=A0ABW9G378_9GAMM